MRTLLQATFLGVTLIGVFVVAGNAERWCPFGGVEAMYTYVTEGNLTCSLAISNFYMLGAVVLITLLLRRAFCGYMCPVGTLSDWLRRLTGRVGVKPIAVPRYLDRSLSLLKYVVFGVVIYFTYAAAELIFRGFDPCYAIISRHGDDITVWAYVILGGLLLGSMLVTMPFCRWLCPLAAVLNPVSRLGLARIRRDTEVCKPCGRCTRACPMGIPVAEVAEVTHARCIACMSCLDTCPQHDASVMSWGPPSRWGGAWHRGVIAVVVLVVTTGAVAMAYVAPLPSFVATRGELRADTTVIDLRVSGLTCRGRANLLMYYLERDDDLQLPEYIHLEAWPGPGAARVRVTVDSGTDKAAVEEAITEPYYDRVEGRWRLSPFEVEGRERLAAP